MPAEHDEERYLASDFPRLARRLAPRIREESAAIALRSSAAPSGTQTAMNIMLPPSQQQLRKIAERLEGIAGEVEDSFDAV